MTSMRAAPGGRISLGGAVSSALLPLLLSAFAVYVRQPLLLIPIAFWKAFLFSYVTCGLYLSWGSAGWLVSGLLMSVSAWSMPVLCWYWLRHIGGRPFDKLSFGISFGALAVIGILNDCLIVPFLADIITF